jgi:hypothetical protein
MTGAEDRPAAGYGHPLYASSLCDSGRPLLLPGCGGWLLARPVPGSSDQDACGCYPLFTCADWSALPEDLARLGRSLVSLVLVTDPFGPDNAARLAPHFSHGAEPYKEHTVVDLRVPLERSVCRHHRRNARSALARVRVELLADPMRHLDEWVSLYSEMTRRHRIRGISAFSRRAFARQLATPGLVALRASAGGEVVGMTLWYAGEEVGYYHLAAFTPQGYELKASFALFWAALEYFRGRLSWLNLGAGAGAHARADDGLARFKRGWSPLTRTAHLCRHVFQSDRYLDLCRGLERTNYFPAYRGAEAATE